MAGESIVAATEYPDDFCELTFGPFTSASADQFLPFLSERRWAIDNVRYVYTVAGGASAAARLFRGILTSTSEDTATETETAARDICSSMDLTAAACVVRDATISTDENIIEPGQVIALGLSGTLTGLANLFITIRLRSRLK